MTIPSQDRNDVISRAKELSNGLNNIAVLIYAISRIPTECRNDVILRANQLFTEDTKSSVKALIIDLTRSHSHEELVQFKEMFFPDTDLTKCAFALDAILKISPDGRRDVFERAKALFYHRIHTRRTKRRNYSKCRFTIIRIQKHWK